VTVVEYKEGMSDPPSEAALGVYREALLDPDLQTLRREFVTVTAESLEAVAGWVGFDSFLGGGDLLLDGVGADGTHDADRYLAFRAVAATIEMAGELAAGTVQLLGGDKRYASATLIRQLIETEYLLTEFDEDFTRAGQWARSTPDEIRRSFSPKLLRKTGGFPDREYWTHCDIGGHPSPAGRVLLRYNVAVHPSEDDVLTASMWADLAQHVRRVWWRVDSLLVSQHARYGAVRQESRTRVEEIEERWMRTDPLAGPTNFGLLDELLSLDDEGGSTS
jgi:hypothetical protein